MSRPASTPRRWPDLLIGLLVLFLLAGFGILLLKGNQKDQTSLAPAAVSPSTTETQTPPKPVAPEIPAAPTAKPATPAPTAVKVEGKTPTATTGDGSTGTSDTDTASNSTATPEIQPVKPAVNPVIKPPVTPPVTPVVVHTSPATVTPKPVTPKPATSQPATSQPATTTPVVLQHQAVATSEQRMPLRSDNRIHLGSFSNINQIRSQTKVISNLGYVIYPIRVGSEFVAQIGPFTDEATARKALAEIKAVYPSALYYPPVQKTPTETATTPATSATPEPSSAEPTSTATSGLVYLQVGAFSGLDGAQKLITQLRDLGYVPTVNTLDNGRVNVLVGPYTDANNGAIERTENRLDSNSIKHFQVRRSARIANSLDSASLGDTSSSPQTNTPVAPAQEVIATPATGEVFLQVGAFDSMESAQKMITELRGLGYVPTVNAPEGRKITIYVGPYKDETNGALGRTEARLDKNGIDHFQVR